MRIQHILLLLVLFLSACIPTSEPLDSGIEGLVTIGPMCPVVQEDVPCPDQPYLAILTILTMDGKEIAQFQTDESGRFRVELAPGEYVLRPDSPNGLPFAADVVFRVNEHEFTRLEISYDSGIR